MEVVISHFNILKTLEAVAGRCSVKKVFFKILQNSPENTCVEVPF